MEMNEFVFHASIDVHTLETWIEAGWIAPHRNESGARYSDVDLARARLIKDLSHIGVNEAGVPIILDLVDQLHGVRGLLREVLASARRRPSGDEPG
jgi:chaperone modulatory protein CbpM